MVPPEKLTEISEDCEKCRNKKPRALEQARGWFKQGRKRFKQAHSAKAKQQHRWDQR
jgi:ribosomal protein L20